MDILFLLIPLSVVLVLLILGVFAWALHGGPVRRPRGRGRAHPAMRSRDLRLMRSSAAAPGRPNNRHES